MIAWLQHSCQMMTTTVVRTKAANNKNRPFQQLAQPCLIRPGNERELLATIQLSVGMGQSIWSCIRHCTTQHSAAAFLMRHV